MRYRVSYPAYNMSGPAPSITRNGPHKNFFSGTFGVWIGSTGEGEAPMYRVCRLIRRHELLKLMGLRGRIIRQLLAAPWDLVEERMRCVPGVQGLAAAFTSIRQAETLAATQETTATSRSAPLEVDEHPTSSAFAGDITPLTTIVLPTDNAWVEATEDDADMRLIV